MGKGIDVLLGGGEDDFHSRDNGGCFPGRGEQPVGMDLISGASENGYMVVCSEEALMRIDTTQTDKLVGLFGAEEIIAPFSPSLVEMTRVAVEILSRDPDGFFLMVEAGQIDWAGHDNRAEEAMEFTLGLDNAVFFAQIFALENPNTLIIVAADHETGGMQPNTDGAGSFRQDGPFSMPDGNAFWVDWETTSHTGVKIPVTAQGPYAENLVGEYPLTKIFETMILHLFSSNP
jgi:alkaline phosphatase